MKLIYVKRDLTLDSLRGEVVSFTGDLTYMTREEAMNYVRAAGGKSPSGGSLTKQTTVLVYGKANVGSKYDRAMRDPTIEVISSDQFIDLLGLRGSVRRGEKLSSRRETKPWQKPANYDRPGRKTELDIIAGQGGVDRDRRALAEGEQKPSLSPPRRSPGRQLNKPKSKPKTKPRSKSPRTPKSTQVKPALPSDNSDKMDSVDERILRKYFKR